MSQPRQEGEFHRADPAYKRQLWGWFAFTVVAGAIVLFALDRWLETLRGGMAADQGLVFGVWLRRLIAGLCLLFAATAVGFGLWLRHLATATQRERRWPPASMRTSSDVRIRYLTSADALVSQFRAGAWAGFALALGLAAWAAWLLLAAR